MSIKKLTNNEFDSAVASGLALIDFYADWCGPCRMLAPTIEAIAEERPDVIVGKVNVDSEGELARKFGIFSIPTLVVLRDGEEVDRAVGFRSREQILELLD